jgi:hypothetical protein
MSDLSLDRGGLAVPPPSSRTIRAHRVQSCVYAHRDSVERRTLPASQPLKSTKPGRKGWLSLFSGLDNETSPVKLSHLDELILNLP